MFAPAAVLAVVLFEAAVGGLALLWGGPTFGKVRHGFEILLGTSLGLLALGAWAAMRGPLDFAATQVEDPAISLAAQGLGATAVFAFASVALVLARAPRAGRVVGLAGAAVGAATFVPLAQLRELGAAAPVETWLGVAELALGALFLGAVWNGMVLGHWYLVERRLTNAPMIWMAWANVVAAAAGIAAVALSSRNSVPCAGLTGEELQVCLLNYSPVLTIDGFTVVMGLGIAALVAIISAFNVKLAREGGRSIQAATGMFYLAVILAPAAEFAAKVRFF